MAFPSYTAHSIYCFLLFLLAWDQGSLETLVTTHAAVKAPSGNISRAEQAVGFHIYYGQSFKVIKNAVDSKSYLLMQLLGLLGSMKGITSDSVSSECLLKAYKEGRIEKVSNTSPQQTAEFAAHFITNTDQPQACNFATFSHQVEHSALQKAEWIKYIGVFANIELRANQVYDQVIENYMCLTNFGSKAREFHIKTISCFDKMEFDRRWRKRKFELNSLLVV